MECLKDLQTILQDYAYMMNTQDTLVCSTGKVFLQSFGMKILILMCMIVWIKMNFIIFKAIANFAMKYLHGRIVAMTY